MTTYHKLVAIQHSKNFREAVEIQTVELREPDASEILIKTRYTGVNAADFMMAAGQYVSPTPPPFDMGGEAVGEVIAVGADVKTFKVGDKALTLGGGYGEYLYTRAAFAIPVPAATAEIVSFGVGGLTASIALEVVGEMRERETVLVTAAAGGTGHFAVQLAKLAGCTVIGTCSSEEKAEMLRGLGCDRAINYKTEDMNAVLKAEFPRGVNVIFESVGGEMFDLCMRHLAVRGRLVTIGLISEYVNGVEIINAPRVHFQLLRKSASIRGFWLNHFFREYGRVHMDKLIGLVNEGKLVAEIDPTHFVGLESVADAVDYLYAGKNKGKVVVQYAS
jgi:prostaglandin reductase 3